MANSLASGEGLVIAAHGRRGSLRTAADDQLRYLVKGRSMKVVCGDYVNWTAQEHGDTAIITSIVTRKNSLERQPVGRSGSEVLAANLTCLVVVCAPKPTPDWFLIDRYLCAATLMNCRCILVENKSDLADATIDTQEADNYAGIGYPWLRMSATDGKGTDALAVELCDATAIFVGQSGVGKSSLINSLVPDAKIRTGALSTASDEGTHTTTASIMHDLPGGGRLIDTPGVRDFVPAIPDTTQIQSGFPEIAKFREDCRFKDCQHLREPDCAVKQALTDGQITPRRYESYRRLLRMPSPRY
jgi:ribosome biogenesis GTPase